MLVIHNRIGAIVAPAAVLPLSTVGGFREENMIIDGSGNLTAIAPAADNSTYAPANLVVSGTIPASLENGANYALRSSMDSSINLPAPWKQGGGHLAVAITPESGGNPTHIIGLGTGASTRYLAAGYASSGTHNSGGSYTQIIDSQGGVLAAPGSTSGWFSQFSSLPKGERHVIIFQDPTVGFSNEYMSLLSYNFSDVFGLDGLVHGVVWFTDWSERAQATEWLGVSSANLP